MSVRIITGDCREVMATMEPESVDAIVTDPPYLLNFMGKEFDSQGGAHRNPRQMQSWHQAWAEEAYRVLKPGGHLLAFGGTRTFHRLTVAIEDAGFEIRDCLSWLYGSGFPKSLDVSKAIDKAAGAEREVVGVKSYLREGTTPVTRKATTIYANGESGENVGQESNTITAPATDLARQWDGWGTALKPSTEPVVWAIKPQTVRGYCGIMAPTIRSLLCQLRSYAKDAGESSPSNQNGYGVASDSALWNAVEQSSTPDDLYGLMDTWLSELAMISNWSIVWSWLRILADLWQRENTYTTETAIGLITDLRTLNSLLSTITAGDIIQAEMQPNGDASSVLLADAIFRGALAKSLAILGPFAAEPATSVDEGKALRPNLEFICMARKPLIGSVAANVTRYGTGAINVDGCRIGTDGGTRGSEFVPNSTPIYGKGFGGKVTIEQISAGRWPANVLLGCACDGETHNPDCAAAMLDAQSGERPAGKPQNRYTPAVSDGSRAYGAGIGAPETRLGWDKSPSYVDTGGASRFFYTAKASRAERNKGLDGMPERRVAVMNAMGDDPDGEIDPVSERFTTTKQNHHPTVKPLDLMQWLVRLVTPCGGTVLDPFCGSGSTLIAADREGFDAIGIEQDEDYVRIAARRCQGDAPMFANVAAD